MGLFKSLRKTNRPATLTEGENYVAKFLEDLNIEYESEKVLTRLKNDTKEFRRVDFYLPEFDVYLEYNGQWDVNEFHRNRYREKRRVLEQNNYSLVELYPNQLGIIEYSLPRNIARVLSEKQNHQHLLRKFRWKMVRSEGDFPDYALQLLIAFILYVSFVDSAGYAILLPPIFILRFLKLRRIWKKYDASIVQPTVREDWSLVLDEVKQQMSYAGIRISSSKLVDFFRGRNESVFSELRESEHYGRFRTETDDFVEELFELKPAASASNSDIKSVELEDIAKKIREMPIAKQEVEDYIRDIRKEHPRSHEPWSQEEDNLLIEAFQLVKSPGDLRPIFKRTSGAIRSRIRTLDL